MPWYENEVTNVIREGRTNPPVPILILGIEPEMILSNEPIDFTDEDLINILKNSNIIKLRNKIKEEENRGALLGIKKQRIEKIKKCLEKMEET